jgi:hypothetical protein
LILAWQEHPATMRRLAAVALALGSVHATAPPAFDRRLQMQGMNHGNMGQMNTPSVRTPSCAPDDTAAIH